jgi:hypothetical protein
MIFKAFDDFSFIPNFGGGITAWLSSSKPKTGVGKYSFSFWGS